MQAIKYATDFAWSQSNGANLSTAGAKTVTLASCPAGVIGTEPQYYVYISGTGTAEAVLVTGGTCAGNSQSGTLQFTIKTLAGTLPCKSCTFAAPGSRVTAQVAAKKITARLEKDKEQTTIHFEEPLQLEEGEQLVVTVAG